MEQPAKKQRAAWKRRDEKILLQCYLGDRNDATLRSDKGIKSKGWAKVVARLAQHGVTADKDQCKTKYSRLMYEYDTFKRLKDMSGAGWKSEIQAPTFSDEVWENLAKTQSRNAPLLKRFREEGFPHDDVCALIAGDSRATAADAANISSFATCDVGNLLQSTQLIEEPEGSSEVAREDGAVADQTTAQVSPPSFSSPTVAERTQRVKRYRDGRKKKQNNQVEESNAALVSFFKTAERYFQTKMKLLARELSDQHESDSD